MIFVPQVINRKCIHHIWPSVQLQNTMGVVFVGIIFLIPLSIIVYSYIIILFTLSKRLKPENTATNVSSQDTVGNQVNNTFQKAKKNTLVTVLIISFCFIICWVQNQGLLFKHYLGYGIDWNSNYYHYTVLMVNLNCMVNPFIYLVKYHDYQQALREFIGLGKRETGGQSEGSITHFSTVSK